MAEIRPFNFILINDLSPCGKQNSWKKEQNNDLILKRQQCGTGKAYLGYISKLCKLKIKANGKRKYNKL